MATQYARLTTPGADLDAIATLLEAEAGIVSAEVVGKNWNDLLTNPGTTRTRNSVQLLITGAGDANITAAIAAVGGIARITNAEAALDAEAGVLDVSVAAGADDGFSTGVPAFSATGDTLLVGHTAPYDGFFRFLGVAVPQGATITSAYLEVVAAGGAGGVLTNVYGNDADDAVAPTDRTTHEAKVRTTAFTARDVPPAWALGATYQVAINAVIQEIVDRAGWVSGNALMLLWDDDGTPIADYLTIAAFEHATYAAPLLHIEYI